MLSHLLCYLFLQHQVCWKEVGFLYIHFIDRNQSTGSQELSLSETKQQSLVLFYSPTFIVYKKEKIGLLQRKVWISFLLTDVEFIQFCGVPSRLVIETVINIRNPCPFLLIWLVWAESVGITHHLATARLKFSRNLFALFFADQQQSANELLSL